MDREIAIAGYYEAQPKRKSGRDILDWLSEAASGTLRSAGVEKAEVDGLIVNAALGGGGSPFWSILAAEALGMSPGWLEATLSTLLAQTEDAREGPRSFVEKRPAVWQGR